MKQPKIKIFNGIYKVLHIEFQEQTGLIDRIVYAVDTHQFETVFRGDSIDNKSLIGQRKIKEPTRHPYHNFAYAPDLDTLLVWD